MEEIIKYPASLLVGFIATLLLTPLWKSVAPRIGFMDQPGHRKIHVEPIPRGGGIAVFVGFHAVCALVFLYPWKPFAGQISIDWWYRFIVLSSAVVALGMVDDRFNIRPWLKLLGQALIATAAYLLEIRVQNLLGYSLPLWADYLATLLWFLVLMNSFNLIDGIDGLAAGIASISALGIAISLVFRKAPGDVLLFLGLAGACLAFLRYNFYPASVFLGDTGSLFIGFTLGALALSTNSKGPAMAGIGMPLLAVGVPLFDTLLAVWRRSMRHLLSNGSNGKTLPEFDRGDSDHLHHRLLRRSRKHSQVAVTLYAFTIFLTVAGILASIFHDRALGILGLTFLLAAYTVIRHLAWIELRESGRVVLQGISRPVRRNRTLMYYIVCDLVILNLSLITSFTLIDLHDGVTEKSLKMFWLKSAPVDVVIPFLLLLLFRAYTRVWYLARVSEYIAAGLAVMLGVAVACTVHLLAADSRAAVWTDILYHVLYAGLAAPAVVGVRAVVRLVQDLLFWRNRSHHHAGSEDRPKVLICGAGYRTTLFLRQIAFLHAAQDPGMEIVGLVDRDDAIRGHFVHGIKVLGHHRDIASLVVQHGITTVYLVETLSPDEQEAIKSALSALPVRIIRWDLVETEVT